MVSKLKIQNIVIICVCIVLTFLPIIAAFENWNKFNPRRWDLVSFLNDEEIHSAIIFISIADLLMILGVILVLYGYTKLSNKIDLRISSTTIINWLAISTTIGFYFDLFFWCECQPFWISLNFTITFPLFLLSLIFTILDFEITDTAGIKFFSVMFSVIFMFLTFNFIAIKGDADNSEWIGFYFVCFICLIPAIIVGYIYGLVIARQLKKDVRVDNNDECVERGTSVNSS